MLIYLLVAQICHILIDDEGKNNREFIEIADIVRVRDLFAEFY